MINRITLDLAFDDYDSLNDLLEEAERRISQAVIINEGKANEEIGFFEIRKCFHDDDTRNTPDEILARFEVGRGKVI